jgi:hypothetical protein
MSGRKEETGVESRSDFFDSESFYVTPAISRRAKAMTKTLPRRLREANVEERTISDIYGMRERA